jgi:hypothetical protein
MKCFLLVVILLLMGRCDSSPATPSSVSVNYHPHYLDEVRDYGWDTFESAQGED